MASITSAASGRRNINEVVSDKGAEWEIRMSTPRGESVMRVKRVK